MFKKNLLATLILLPVGAWAEPFELEAPVQAATIYFNGADLVREAVVNLPSAGEHVLKIHHINSVRDIKISGATLLSSSQHTDKLPVSFSQTEIALQKARYDLEAFIKQIDNYELLAKSLSKSAEKSPQTVDQVLTQLENIQMKIVEHRAQLVEKENVVRYLEQRLANEQHEQGNQMNDDTLILHVQANQAGEARIQLYAYDPQVNWQPSSTIDLETKNQQIQFNAFADIYQESTEDWKNVKITLAIAPLQDYQLPVWQSESLYLHDPISNKEAFDVAQKTAMLGGARTTFIAEAVAPQSYANSSVPVIQATGMDFQVVLPSTYNISHDDTAHIAYWQGQAPANTYTAIYQWAQPVALVVSQWQQPKEIAFFAGQTQIKRDGITIGSRYYDLPWQANSEQKMSFGVDTAISVNRTTPPEFTGETGIIGKQNVRQIRENFTLTANRDSEHDIRFYARLPNASVEDIEVKPQWSINPTERETDGRKDFMMWQVGSLKAGEKWQLNYGYDVKYPQDKELY